MLDYKSEGCFSTNDYRRQWKSDAWLAVAKEEVIKRHSRWNPFLSFCFCTLLLLNVAGSNNPEQENERHPTKPPTTFREKSILDGEKIRSTVNRTGDQKFSTSNELISDQN